MKVKLRFFGALAQAHGRDVELNLKPNISWGEAVEYVFERYKLGKIKCGRGTPVRSPGYLLIFLNGKEQAPETELSEGDEISILHPLVGG